MTGQSSGGPAKKCTKKSVLNCTPLWLLCVGVVVFFCFLILGAIVFGSIETAEEDRVRKDLLDSIEQFIMLNPCVEAAALEKLISKIVDANNKGVSLLAESESNWSFGQSFLFSTSLVTTIGYGNVTPLTYEGKIFCICYALIGIPLCLAILTAFVEKLEILSMAVLRWMKKKWGRLYKPFHVRLFHLFLIANLVLIIFLLMPASMFRVFESKWSYFDSFYYCFISLTTIGLGDYVPGDDPIQPYRTLYKLFISCYLLAGSIAMMLLLNSFYEIPRLHFGIMFVHLNDDTNDAETIGYSTDEERTRLSGSTSTEQTSSYSTTSTGLTSNTSSWSEEYRIEQNNKNEMN